MATDLFENFQILFLKNYHFFQNSKSQLLKLFLLSDYQGSKEDPMIYYFHIVCIMSYFLYVPKKPLIFWSIFIYFWPKNDFFKIHNLYSQNYTCLPLTTVRKATHWPLIWRILKQTIYKFTANFLSHHITLYQRSAMHYFFVTHKYSWNVEYEWVNSIEI